MTREDLKNYKSNKEYLRERIQDLEEAKSEVTKITTIISDMPKRE